jgi:tRNA wybutosine-synthesizing protein 1
VPLPFGCVYVLQGVTYCGESKASSLTMKNVPWHEEVVSFVQQLADQLPDYEIASEHEHSNCVLIAHKKVSRCRNWFVKFTLHNNLHA